MTTLEQVQAELADGMAPLPELWAYDLSPQAAVLYAWELAKTVLSVQAAAAMSTGADVEEEQPVITEILNGCSAALAGYTHALVVLEVLPQAAEDALVTGAGTPQSGEPVQ